MAKKRYLPFCLVPAHWGLSGKAKEIAKAYYYNDDYEADIIVAELTYLTPYEVEKAQLDIKKKYGVISEALEYLIAIADLDLKYSKITRDEYNVKILDAKLSTEAITKQEYDLEIIELMPDSDDKLLKTIEYAYSYGEITQQEYSKEIFTLRKEPWIDLDVILNDSNEVEFIFDYNEYFVKKLKDEGHPGNDEEELIDNFIRDLGRKLATDEFSDNYDVKLVAENEGIENLPGLPDGFKRYK